MTDMLRCCVFSILLAAAGVSHARIASKCPDLVLAPSYSAPAVLVGVVQDILAADKEGNYGVVLSLQYVVTGEAVMEKAMSSQEEPHNLVVIAGFGSPTNCLVTASRTARYSLSVDVDGSNVSLWYDGISSPAILLPTHSVSSRTKRQSKVTSRACCDRGISVIINDDRRTNCPASFSVNPLPSNTSPEDCRDSHILCCRCCLVARLARRIGRNCANLADEAVGECRTEYLRCCHYETYCPELSVPRNGMMSCQLRNNGVPLPSDTCSITCNEGYLLTGSSTRTCQSNRNWSGSDTLCTRTCSPLSDPSNGIMNCSLGDDNIPSEGETCSFICSTGYELTGSDTRSCQSDGSWSGSDDVCKRVTCPSLSDPSDGTISCSLGDDGVPSYEDTCSFTCDTGYGLTGSDTRTCQSNGSWSGSVAMCSRVTCSSLSDPSNGMMNCSLGDDGVPSYEDTCSFTCDTGYELTGSDTRSCQSDGSWSGSVAMCSRVTCPSLSDPSNGMISCSLGDDGVPFYEDTCSFTCDTGYELTGSDTRSCQSDGSWSGPQVSCVLMKCPISSLPLDSLLPEACDSTYQSICELQCLEGFNGTGNSSYVCDLTGSSVMWRPLGDVWMCDGDPPPPIICAAGDLTAPLISLSSIKAAREIVFEGDRPAFWTISINNTTPEEYARVIPLLLSPVSLAFSSDVTNILGEVFVISVTLMTRNGNQYNLTFTSMGIVNSTEVNNVEVLQFNAEVTGSYSPNWDRELDRNYSYRLFLKEDTAGEVVGDSNIEGGNVTVRFKYDSKDNQRRFNNVRVSMNYTALVVSTDDSSLSFNLTSGITGWNSSCPVGSGGFRCYACQEGYYGRPRVGIPCRECMCNGPSSKCHRRSGRCFNCVDNTAGKYCQKCKRGYVGDAVNGVCQLPCPSLPDPSNGMMNCSLGDDGVASSGDTCSFTCDTGYELTGSDTRSCQSDGSWSGSQVSCVIMKCPISSLPLDSLLPEACNNTYQSICELQCLEGFNGTGNSSYVCDLTRSSVMWRPLGDVWMCDGDPLPPAICAAGDLTAPLISLSSIKAAREIVFEDDRPAFWTISINNTTPEEYARVIPLLLSPVSLAFSSDVTNILGEVFVINVTLMTRNGNQYNLTFTSMGIVNSTEVNNVEVLQFNAEVTGSYSPNWDRELDRNYSYRLFLKEDTAGEVVGDSNIEGGNVTVRFKYDSKDDQRRFNNVRVSMNYTALVVSTDDSLLSFNLASRITGWNSSCPVGSGGFRCYACQEGYYGRPRVGIPCRECMCNGHSSKCHRRSGRCFNCADNTAGKYCQKCKRGYVGDAVNGVCQLPCPSLPDPSNGMMNCSLGDDGVPSSGDTCSFTCDTGYELTGSDTRSCQSDGSWSGSVAMCSRVTCPSLSDPSNGMINCSLGDDEIPSYEDTCSFTCDTGYELTGSDTRSCQSDGSWSGSVAMCSRECPSLSISNGVMNCSLGDDGALSSGDTCSFTCDTGYELTGSNARTCQSDGSWSGSAAVCSRVTCPSLSDPSNGTMNCSLGDDGVPSFGDTCSFTCDTGYELTGSDTRSCQSDGSWSGSQVSCVIMKCPISSLPLDSLLPEACDNTYQSICELQCPEGFNGTGNSSYVCDLTGSSVMWRPLGDVWMCDGDPPPPIICAAGDLTAPLISLSSIKAAREIVFEDDRPAFWTISINNTSPEEYARVIPLLLSPVSLAFSSDVTNILGEVFVINVTIMTRNGNQYNLTFTSMGIVNSTEVNNVEVLQFSAEVTGSYSPNWDRELDRNYSYRLFLKEDTAGEVVGDSNIRGGDVTVRFKYDSKDNQRRFNNVRVSMNYTALVVSTDDSSLSFNLTSGITGWNSSCPVGSGGFRCYACQEGYYGRPRVGIPCRECMCNGHSSKCQRRSGRCFNCADNTAGKYCQKCKRGYVGDAVNGVCQLPCPSLPDPSNGMMNCSLGDDGVPSSGDTCSFTCDTGYELTGSDTRTCQSDGSWSGSAAVCDRVTCPLLSDPSNGMISCSLGDDGVPSYEDTCSFTCDTGYELTGSDTRSCQNDGSWSGSLVSCVIMKCPISSLPLDSLLPEACNDTYQSICELQCPEGFNGTGNSSYVCDLTGSLVMWRPLGDVWTCDGDPPPPIICAAGDLTAPLISLSSIKAAREIVFEGDRPAFWTISINNTTPGEYARVIPLLLSPVSLAFSSDVTNILGEMFVINVTLMTRNGNQYNLTFTSMGIVNSTEVNNVEVLQFNAEVTGSYSPNWDRELDRNYSYRLFLKEDTAGEVVGDSNIRGGDVTVRFKYDSKDNQRRFKNVRVSANYTALVVSTDDSSLSFNLTSGITGWNSSCPVGSGGFRCYACQEGYYGRPRVGIPCRECMCNGHSSKCQRRSGRCFNCADNTAGKYCHKCKRGYVGDAVNGVCQLPCPSLPDPSNGMVNCSPGDDGVPSSGDTCSFTCDTGYELTGSDTRTCQSDGSWSGSVAMCSRVICPSLSISNGMIICSLGDDEVPSYEDTCSFTCDTGYELTGSDTRTCQSDGSWSGSQASCVIMKCPISSLPLDSLLPEACNNTYQSMCELQCPEGFNGTGNSSYVCDLTGSSVMWRPLGDVWTCDGDPPPPIICAAGDLTAPLISLSSIKAAREIVFEDDRPAFWTISINNTTPEEYARVIPLLLSPVSLAFSSDVTNILGEMFVINVTIMTRNGNQYNLTFTSMGIVNSTEVNNVEVLQFNAEVTGSYSPNWDRELDRNYSYRLFLKEDTAGEVVGDSNIRGGDVTVRFKYDSKDDQRRFNNVRVSINYTALVVSTDDSSLSFNLMSGITGWNSSCPVGSGGFRCYACQEGYYGRPRVGIPCRECMCNGHSSKCHRRSGRCFNCADNTAGKYCQKCKRGYVGDAVNGVCQLRRPPTLFINGSVNAPDVGLEEGIQVGVSYLLDGSEPAKWEVTLPNVDNLTQFAILFPLHLPPIQFILTDNAAFFNGTFNSIATVARDDTFFTLNITGGGLSVEGNLTTITFDATAYGDFDLTSYVYDLSELTVSYEVNEDTPGSVVLSTSVEADLPLEVVFEYSPTGSDERPFDEQQFVISQSSVTTVDNKLVFSATNSLVQVQPPPTICAIGNFSTPIIPLSSVKAIRESSFDEDKPVVWEINIPNGAEQAEYPRVLPLLLTPVSLAFSSNVLDVIGDIFTVNMNLRAGGRTFLAFTSSGFERSDDFEILRFNAEGTGSKLSNQYVRGLESDVISMNFREETPGSVSAVGDIGEFRMRLNMRYDTQTATRRFTNVELIINHTDLTIINNTMRFKVSSKLVGWNSSCPLGSAGFRCYRCLEGYFGSPIRNIPCRRCMCNGHSDRCNRRTGRCINCADNTSGRRCQNCASRYYGNATNGGVCNPCRCDPDGSRGEVCNNRNGQCRCYSQIIGRTCDTCAQEGYYGPQRRRCRMCRCHPNNTMECTKREGRCRCRGGWTGDTCSEPANCSNLTTGDTCGSCIDGYYGDPNNGRPCQKCICNNNIDLNVTGNCHSRSGRCLKCVNNTDGDQCEQCAMFYYGDAVNGTCIPCGCNHPNGAHNRRCDVTTGQCNCRPDITGRTCDTCVMEGFYGPINRQCRRCRCVAENTNECNRMTGECSCKDDWIGDDCSIFNGSCPEGTTGSQCDVCIVGYYGDPKNNRPCQECDCNGNNDLTVPGNCHRVNGRCSNCLNNTDGDSCQMCAEGYYGDAVNGECIPCNCNSDGSTSQICHRSTGACRCRRRVTGRACDQCRHGTSGFRNCQPCKCKAGRTYDNGGCDPITGQCHCLLGYSGLRCGQEDNVAALRYNGSSYSPYTTAVSMATMAQLGATVGLENENGILYYLSEFENGTGSYFLTRFVNGTIELSFSINGSKTVIRGTNKLPLGQLMSILIAISEDLVSIRITLLDKVLESITEPVSITIVTVGTFYAGGVPPTHILPVATSNLIGCMEKPITILLDNVQSSPLMDVGISLCGSN